MKPQSKSKPRPKPEPERKPRGLNSGDPVKDCLAEVVPIIRVGFDLMNAEQCLAFVDQLRSAIHTIMTEVAQQDVETDGWAEN
jgi:hypothetical protein